MVNATRKRNGRYQVGGKSYQMLVGSRVQVWNGTAKKTGYGKKGLTRGDLVKNKWGRIVSRKKHVRGKKSGLKRLHAKGWFVSKGKFGATQRKGRKGRKATGKRRRKTKRCRNKKGNRFIRCPK
tara:strand:+ start:3513 stop:3884 length:372 start_codon:yes stop_codon:yes gene_type:complete